MNTAEGIFLIKVINKKAQRIKVSLGLEVDEIEVFSDLLQQNDIFTKQSKRRN